MFSTMSDPPGCCPPSGAPAADVGTMMFANLGVSMPGFVLGLLLASLFAIIFKDTPLSLPPSGRLSSGVEVVPLAEVWGLEAMGGPPRALLDFVSGIYTISARLSAQWEAWADAIRLLILPAIALGTIPLAIIARITARACLRCSARLRRAGEGLRDVPSRPTRPATRCCRSSRSSASSWARSSRAPCSPRPCSTCRASVGRCTRRSPGATTS
jgi:hypothetical protein